MTLTTEQLSQIKADISARKAMPEYGESVEGNIDRLRVIGATRSHFSTETVEMLVRALEEKSRALADAERERDDWVEHSRRMEYRAIEAKELLANREAQPVTTESLSMEKAYQRAEREMTICSSARDIFRFSLIDLLLENQLYTAPPAPAVPECFLNAVAALEYLYRNGQKQNWNERYTADMAYSSGVLNACRAAMLGGEK